MTAYLTGTRRQPEVALVFGWGARHAANGLPLQDWVKKAPGRRWDPERKCWIMSGFGPGIDPEALLRKAGFTIEMNSGYPGEGLDPSLHDVFSLGDLITPMAKASVEKAAVALVRHRFYGWEATKELLGMGAHWDKATGRFEVPLTDLLLNGEPKPGIIMDADTIAKAKELVSVGPISFNHLVHSDESIAAAATAAASSSGVGDGHDEAAIQRLVDVVGDIPEWFGMTPRPYQRLGALALITGRGFLADPTGLGKTLQIIGAFAVKGVQRGVIIVPPVVVTHWAREIEKCGLAAPPPKPLSKAALKRQEKAAKKAAIDAAIAAGMDPEMASRMTFRPPRKATPSKRAPLRSVQSPETAKETTAPAEVSVVSFAQASGGSTSATAPPESISVELGNPDVPSVTGVANRVDTKSGNSPLSLVTFRAGRKEPELPERGIIVVPDSLLAKRPALKEKIAAWAPDGIAYDEAHRARTWTSVRSEAVRDLCNRSRPGTLRIASTATPLFASPHELASLLAITGHLDTVFGGYSSFIATYCKRNYFKQLVPRPEMLEQLRQILRDQVWVRRDKKEVLKDLPPKRRDAMFVDVDLKGFRAAHNEVIDKVTEWLDEFFLDKGREPDDEEVEAWAKTQIGLMSPLRKAAGVAKVPAALDMSAEWIDENVALNADGTFTCERPLLLWAHHQEVVEAARSSIASHIKANLIPMVAVIDGATSATERGRLVDEFQAGRLPILICSITAAGVGITLTKASDALFIETDYSPPIVSQAEDRIWRMGQTKHVQILTMIAEGTLDERIQDILKRKSAVIGEVTGDIDDVSVMDSDGAGMSPSDIIVGLVNEARDKWKAPSVTGTAAAVG
jgi:hypothetical protein